MNNQAPVALTFLQLHTMTKEEIQTKLYERIASLPSGQASKKPSKQRRPSCASASLTKTFVPVRTTGRAAAAAAKTTHAEPTRRADYEAMLNGIHFFQFSRLRFEISRLRLQFLAG